MRLIVKYLIRQATLKELEKLELWIKNPINEVVFKHYVKINHAIDYAMKEFDTEGTKKRLLDIIDQEKKANKIRKLRNIVKYAAVVLLFVTAGYFYWQGYFNRESELYIKEEKITLQLDNGNTEVIEENDSIQIADAQGNILGVQKGNQLNYTVTNRVETLVYNTLTVPYGKRFEVILSDGSVIYMNSGTSLKYPVKFLQGQDRQVFLNGEAFFRITENKEHPFIVNTQELNVQVLGTHFNVTAYPEDTHTDVVLVEGSVGMYAKNKDFDLNRDIILKPGMMGAFNKIDQEITTKQINTIVYTSWVKGNVVFRNVSFDNIVTKLQRLYNVTIINNNAKLAKETFNASIDVENESIEEVLNYFNKIYHIEYQIVNNKIVIN